MATAPSGANGWTVWRLPDGRTFDELRTIFESQQGTTDLRPGASMIAIVVRRYQPHIRTWMAWFMHHSGRRGGKSASTWGNAAGTACHNDYYRTSVPRMSRS